MKKREIEIENFWIFSFSIFFFIFIELFIYFDRISYTIDNETAYWFCSAMLQAFAALLAIMGGFIVIRKPSLKSPVKKSYPSLVFLGSVVIFSIVLLPLIPFLQEKSPSLLSTAILIMLILGVYGIVYVTHPS